MSSAVQTRTTDDLADLRREVRRFVDDELIVREPILDRNDESSAEAMAELKTLAKQRGVWALGHPASIGGGGLPFLDYVMINEIVGRSYWGTEALGTLSFQDCLMLLEFGTDEQRDTWIPLLFEGVTGPTIGMTEPEVAGSDPTLIRTTAVLDGDDWVINGHKWFTSGANHALYTTVFAKTDPEAPKHQQFSLILVPTDTPGYDIQRVVRTMGHYGGNHCEVRYDNVRVPARNLVGPRGGGFAVAQARLGPGRITHSMRWLGQAQRAFELMCDRASTRYAHGSLLSEKGEIQRYIAESAAQIQAARLMTLDAARTIDAGRDARVEISLIKFFGAQMLHDVIDRAIQVHGALGVTEDTPLERMYRDARYARIYDGPDEVHRMVVAKRLLRNYKDAAPWSDVVR